MVNGTHNLMELYPVLNKKTVKTSFYILWFLPHPFLSHCICSGEAFISEMMLAVEKILQYTARLRISSKTIIVTWNLCVTTSFTTFTGLLSLISAIHFYLALGRI